MAAMNMHEGLPVGTHLHMAVMMMMMIVHPTPRIALSVGLSVRDKISAVSWIYASYIHSFKNQGPES